jgi:hypothetical protein
LPEVARPKSADERLQAERAERAKEAASIQRQEGAKQRSLFSGWALRGPDVAAANQAKQAADAERARAERAAAKAADELKLQQALSAARVHAKAAAQWQKNTKRHSVAILATVEQLQQLEKQAQPQGGGLIKVRGGQPGQPQAMTSWALATPALAGP